MAASTGQVRVYNGVGDGTIEATPTLLPITGVTSQIVASDLDGDGDEDLVTAQYAAHTVTIVENLGARTFDLAEQITVGSYPTTMPVADLAANHGHDARIAPEPPTRGRPPSDDPPHDG